MMVRLPAKGWFKKLSETTRAEIEESGIYRSYSARETLFLQSKPLTEYYFVMEGLVSVYQQNTDGKKWVASLFSSDDFFPHVGLLTDAYVYPASAETVSNSTLFVLPRKKALIAFDTIPELQNQLTCFLADKSQELMNRFSDSIFSSASDRYLTFLRRLALKTGKCQPDGRFVIVLGMTSQDMAEYIGVAPETISRIMHHLLSAHLVEKVGKKKLLIKMED